MTLTVIEVARTPEDAAKAKKRINIDFRCSGMEPAFVKSVLPRKAPEALYRLDISGGRAMENY